MNVLIVARCIIMRVIAHLALLVLIFAPVYNRLDAQRIIPAGITSRPHVSVSVGISDRHPAALPLASTYVAETPADTASHAALWGAGIGALIGGAYGFALGYGGCDAQGSHGTCITQATIGGAVICAIAGYGVGWLIGKSRD